MPSGAAAGGESFRPLSFRAAELEATEAHTSRVPLNRNREQHVSKGMDQKKQEKKKPAKTMKEKKAAKKEKSAGKKAFMPE